MRIKLTCDGSMTRVRWDDFNFDALAAQWGEDYAIEARDNGQAVHAANIARIGSPRFTYNDI